MFVTVSDNRATHSTPALLAAVVLAALLCAPSQAEAGSEAEAEEAADERGLDAGKEGYAGAFWEPTIHGGVGFAPETSTPAIAMSAGFRHSFVFLLGDTRLSYQFLRRRGGATDRGTRHGIWLHTALHPLFPVLLGSDWFSYLAASIYFELGVGGLAHASSGEPSPVTPGFGWSYGAGLDVPLGDADSGSIPWMHLLFRRSFDVANAGATGGIFRFDTFTVGLGWRFNGALF